jgi:ABC-2 type transport system ATP-binding protein
VSAIGIAVSGLHKRFGTTQALDGLDLDVEPGLLHGIIGPDGAGKTTTLRMLIGLLRPDAGSVRFQRGGVPVEFASIRPGMAYMPQRQSLYADLSISEHLDFFRELYRLPPEVYAKRREELLAVTRLDKFADRPAGKLSGGMYKKLGLMCALLQSPNVLLLDEPTNGVDPISRREFWDLLYRLAADGETTIVVSTAYMDEAERCARVHLVERGRVLAEGEPRAVLRGAGAAGFDELFLKHGGGRG